MAHQGFDEKQIREAAWAAQSVTGMSTYLYGSGYDLEKYKRELARLIEHMREEEPVHR